MASASDRGAGRQAGILLTIASFTCAAFMVNGVFPVLVDPLIAEGRATLAQAGRLATADYLVTGVISLIAPRVLNVRHFRQLGATAAVLVAVGNLITIALRGDAMLIGRAIAGLGAGVLIWLQYAYIARSRHAELLTGCFLAAFVISSTLVVYLAPGLILPRWGVAGIYTVIAAVAIIAGLAALFAPADLLAGTGRMDGRQNQNPIALPAGLILWSVFFFTAFLASIWVYLGPIAWANNLSTKVLAQATVASLVMQAAGAAAAGAIHGWVRSRWAMLSIISVAVVECLYLMLGSVGPMAFLALAVVLGAIGNAIMPFAVALLGELDRSRRSVEFISAPLVLGGAFGPLMGSFAVAGQSDIQRGILLSLTWSLFALALYGAALALARRNTAAASFKKECA